MDIAPILTNTLSTATSRGLVLLSFGRAMSGRLDSLFDIFPPLKEIARDMGLEHFPLTLHRILRRRDSLRILEV